MDFHSSFKGSIPGPPKVHVWDFYTLKGIIGRIKRQVERFKKKLNANPGSNCTGSFANPSPAVLDTHRTETQS